MKSLFKKFNRWRRFNPPGALTSDAWNSFEREFKIKAPIRYWFDNEFKRIFIYPVKRAYEEIWWGIRYRTFDRYHIVKTGEPPGYRDTDHIILYVNFNLLKDFVEISKASRSYWPDDVPKTWAEKHMPFYTVFYPFRRPDLGVKHLKWEMTLDDPSLPPFEQSVQQAKYARETYALYNWWVEDRPNRVEIVCRHPPGSIDSIFSNKNRNTPEYKIYESDLKAASKQEEKWHKEDDKMLIRLMKIRRGLWA